MTNRSPREWGWVLWLSLLPWAPFLLTRKLDLWHAQTAWAHAGLIVLAASGLTRGIGGLPNRPLAAWTVWIGLFSLLMWHQGILANKTYPIFLLQGAAHLLVVPMFWVAMTSQLTVETLGWLWRGVAISLAVMVGYAALQVAQLDQFFKNMDPSLHTDLLVGTLGNPNHLGVLLAMAVPLFLSQPERWWKYLAGATGLLILATNSVGAIAALIAGLVWWTVAKRKRHLYWIVPALVAAIVLAIKLGQVEDSGRWMAWQHFWHMVQDKALTGWGPGAVFESARALQVGHPMYGWRHCHNEYLQLWAEQGIIGLLLALWFLGETFQRAWRVRKHPVGMAAGAGLLACCVNGVVNFPFHLATVATLALAMVCSIWIVAEESG